MLCPKCKKDTLKNHRTYDSDYLPFRKTIQACMNEKCDFRGFYNLSMDKEIEFTYANSELYKRAYLRLCQVLNEEAVALKDGEDYLSKCQQLSFEIANKELKEKLEEI